MTNKDRDELRKLQDKVVVKLAKMGYESDNEVILDRSPVEKIRLIDIKSLLHPNLRPEFERFLEEA